MARTHSGFDNHVVVYADTDRVKLRVASAMFALCWMFFMNAGTQTTAFGWMAHLVAAFFIAFSVGKTIDLWQDCRVVAGADLAHFRDHPWNAAGQSMFAHVLAHEPVVRISHIRLIAKAHVGQELRDGVFIDPIGARYFGRDIHQHMQGN